MSKEGPGHFPQVSLSEDFAWTVDLENQDWNMPEWNEQARKQALGLYQELKWEMGQDMPPEAKKVLSKIVKELMAAASNQLPQVEFDVDVEGMYRHRLMKLRNMLEVKNRFIPEDELPPDYYGPLLQQIVEQCRERA